MKARPVNGFFSPVPDTCVVLVMALYSRVLNVLVTVDSLAEGKVRASHSYTPRLTD